jgi:uncharacterized protein
VVKDNPERQRFELEVEGQLAFAAYRRAPGIVTFTHTEVPDVFRGKGVGSALAQGALDLVRQSGERVLARCPFIAAYIERHSEYRGLLVQPGA